MPSGSLNVWNIINDGVSRSSRRQFLGQSLVASGGIALTALSPSAAASPPKPEPARYVGDRVSVEDVRKIYSSPDDEPMKYCGWPDIAFWKGTYYVIFSRKTRHIARPIRGPGLVVIQSTDLENWTESVLPDFDREDRGELKGDDRDAKLFATPERLFAVNIPYPHEGQIALTEDGTHWSDWQPVFPGAADIRSGPIYGAQCWRPKQFNGSYYLACDYGNDRVDLLTSDDMLHWDRAGTIMSGGHHPHSHAPSETEIVFLEDGRCLAFTRMNEVPTPTSPDNTLPGFSIAEPPYTSWEFHPGAAIRFGGPAAHRFGDTILVIARAELGEGEGYWNLPVEPGWRWTHRTAVYTFSLREMKLEPQLLLPTEYARDNSYAGILPTGENSAVIVWYDGNTADVSHIWMARLILR